MRTRIAFLVLAACGGSNSATPATGGPGPTNTKSAALDAPVVASAGVIATDDSLPPVLVMIDTRGQRSLAAAASWKALAAGTLVAGPKPAGNEASFREIKEGTILGKDPKTIVDGFTDYRTNAELDPTAVTDDPPPPEEEDDDSGGTGTAMALDEGKMGHKATGKRGRVWSDPRSDDEPARQVGIVGEVTGDRLEHVPALVIPHPSTKAVEVVKAVSELEAMIGVRSGGELRPLRIQFHPGANRAALAEISSWLEVRLDASGLTIEAVPSKASTVSWADAAGKLRAALADARAPRKLDPTITVDVLVAPEIDAQRLVDVLAALDGAGVTSIGLGLVPTGKQFSLRGHEPAPRKSGVPTVAIGAPNAQGDLDKEIIRRFVKRNIQKITYCYEKELLASPRLQGTVQVQFFIKPDGVVGTATGAGVSPAVANCVADVIKGIEFPKPKGGGGVQVNYPFTFRPDGPQ